MKESYEGIIRRHRNTMMEASECNLLRYGDTVRNVASRRVIPIASDISLVISVISLLEIRFSAHYVTTVEHLFQFFAESLSSSKIFIP